MIRLVAQPDTLGSRIRTAGNATGWPVVQTDKSGIRVELVTVISLSHTNGWSVMNSAASSSRLIAGILHPPFNGKRTCRMPPCQDFIGAETTRLTGSPCPCSGLLAGRGGPSDEHTTGYGVGVEPRVHGNLVYDT